MKRLITPVLVVCLILCGCAVQPEPERTAPATVPVPVTEPAGIYDTASQIERFSNGTVKAYPLSGQTASGIAPMGSSILVFSGTDRTTLMKYSGETLKPSSTISLACQISPGDPAVRITETGMTFYDSADNTLVFLDAQLEEVRRVPLPDTLCGIPALSADLQTLYYCTADSLRCLELETKLDRLLKQMQFQSQTTTALHCDDTVIACDVTEQDGRSHRLFINAGTGVLLYEGAADMLLQTCGASYFACHMDGIYPELLVGDSEQGPTLLNPHTYGGTAFPLLETGGAVITTRDQTAAMTQLDYYDLHSGRRTATVTIPGQEPVRSMFAQDSAFLWFLRYDPAYAGDVLCRWDFRSSAINDTRSCFSSRHSADQPDLQGLAYCREFADSLSFRYGVQILLWTDATAYQPWDYTLVPEYQVRVIYENLKELEVFLSMYPEGFFWKAAERTGSGQIQICLVRSILGKEAVDGVLPEAVGLQYWDHNANSYLCLAVQPEQLSRNACHEMSHIIDSRVLTVCKAYDDWNKLNPAGFQYNYSDTSALSTDDRRWTVGADRAFLDLYSMTYPKEDRARIMEYAMMDGFEGAFESETMQKKLRTLCLGIRQAFDLEGVTEPLRWEQYLQKPLYQK